MHTHAPDGMIMIGVFSVVGFLTTSKPKVLRSFPLQRYQPFVLVLGGEKRLQFVPPSVQS